MNFKVSISADMASAVVAPEGTDYEPAMAFLALIVANVQTILMQTQNPSYASRFYHEQYMQPDGVDLRGVPEAVAVEKLHKLRRRLLSAQKAKEFVLAGVSSEGLEKGGALMTLTDPQQGIARDTATILIIHALTDERVTC